LGHEGVGLPWSACTARHLVDHVIQSCERNPGSPLLIFDDGLVVSRETFLELCNDFGAYLAPRVRPGDRVAVAVRNRAEFMIAMIAIAANRAIMVSINPGGMPADVGHILRDSTPVLLIVEKQNVDTFQEITKGLGPLTEVICLADDEPYALPSCRSTDGPFDLRDAHCEPDDITSIFYTSGTTGRPKGCMISHTWWLRMVDVDLRLLPFGRERAMCSVPFYYADPAAYLMIALQAGGSLIAARRFSLSRYWDIVHEFDVTKIHAIASIPILLAKAPPHPLERKHQVHHATSVAVPQQFHQTLVERFGFPWIDCYGSTETGRISQIPWAMRDEMIGSGSIGFPVPGTELCILAENGSLVSPGEIGEAAVRTPGMFNGYFNQPELTAQVMRRGFYLTGDLVRQDESGALFFAGRKKDIIRRSGENISAAEVEAVLRELAGIKDAAVVPVPDVIRGEEVKAFILLGEGVDEDQVPPEMIMNHCLSRLSKYKSVRYIEYWSQEFPHTPSMRVDKNQLKAKSNAYGNVVWDVENAIFGITGPVRPAKT